MGLIATILAVTFEWGGTCIDILNVASPASIWGEWCACGPLLIYINVTIIEKGQFSKIDWILFICFFTCLIAGFFIIIPSSIRVGQFWLTVSCITYIPVLYLPFYDDGVSPTIQVWENTNTELLPMRYAKRTNIARWLSVVLPIYTVIYLVALWGGIDYAVTIAIYQILSVLTKGIFAAATMDVHLDLLGSAEKHLLQEMRANAARRLFMKYIFHEVRTPLNSLTVGINLLSTSD
jgi:signal transduction histidine kinase